MGNKFSFNSHLTATYLHFTVLREIQFSKKNIYHPHLFDFEYLLERYVKEEILRESKDFNGLTLNYYLIVDLEGKYVFKLRVQGINAINNRYIPTILTRNQIPNIYT